MILISWCLPKQKDLDESEVFERATVESTLIHTIDLLDQGDYDALQSMAVEQMKSVLCADTLEEVKADLGADWSARSAVGTIYAQEVTQMNQCFVVCQVNVAYANISVTKDESAFRHSQ